MTNKVFVIKISKQEDVSNRRHSLPVDDVNFTHAPVSLISQLNSLGKSKNNSHFVGLIGVGILFGSIILSMMVTCIPHHNVIKYPEFWYEALSPVITWVPCYAARNIKHMAVILLIFIWKISYRNN